MADYVHNAASQPTKTDDRKQEKERKQDSVKPGLWLDGVQLL